MTSVDRLRSLLDAGRFGPVTSVIVTRGGEIVHESYHDAGGADALRDTRSTTKTVASLLVGIAIDRGDLPGVDAPLLGFFDDLAPFVDDGPVKRSITLRHLLTMTSPLACDDDDPGSPGNEELMYETDDWLRFALDIPVDPDAGGRFHYCTAGVTALAGVLERAAGRPLAEYAAEHLFAPLGIGEVRWTRSPSGLAQTGGGLWLRSRDLLALGRLALDGGRAPDGRRVVSEAWIRASMTAHVPVRDGVTYGYLWWLRRFGDVEAALMAGNGGNKVVVAPAMGMVAVITSTNFNTPGMHEITDRLLTDEVLPLIGAA